MFCSNEWLPHMGHPEEASKAGQSGLVVLIIILLIFIIILFTILLLHLLLIIITILILIFILINNNNQVVRSPSILPSPAVSRRKQEGGDATMVRICVIFFCIVIIFLAYL